MNYYVAEKPILLSGLSNYTGPSSSHASREVASLPDAKLNIGMVPTCAKFETSTCMNSWIHMLTYSCFSVFFHARVYVFDVFI